MLNGGVLSAGRGRGEVRWLIEQRYEFVVDEVEQLVHWDPPRTQGG